MKLDGFSIFVLHIIDNVSSLDNQYRLNRFFGKAELPVNTIFKTLNYLVENNLLEIKDIINTVKAYRLTDTGKTELAKNFNAKVLSDYVNTIDPTGWYDNYLRLIEESKY